MRGIYSWFSCQDNSQTDRRIMCKESKKRSMNQAKGMDQNQYTCCPMLSQLMKSTASAQICTEAHFNEPIRLHSRLRPSQSTVLVDCGDRCSSNQRGSRLIHFHTYPDLVCTINRRGIRNSNSTFSHLNQFEFKSLSLTQATSFQLILSLIRVKTQEVFIINDSFLCDSKFKFHIIENCEIVVIASS